MYSQCLVFFLLAATALSAALNSRPEVSSGGTAQEAASCADILPVVGYSAGRKFCSSRPALSALTSTINPLANRTGTPTQTRRQGWLATTSTPHPTNSLPSAPWDSLEEAEPDQIDRICACVAEATVVIGRRDSPMTTRIPSQPFPDQPSDTIGALDASQTAENPPNPGHPHREPSSSLSPYAVPSASFTTSTIVALSEGKAVHPAFVTTARHSAKVPIMTTTTTSSSSHSPQASSPSVQSISPKCDASMVTAASGGLCGCQVRPYCSQRVSTSSLALLSTVVATLQDCLYLLDQDPLATLFTFDGATNLCLLYDCQILDLATDTLDVISGARFGTCDNPVCQVLGLAENDAIVASTAVEAGQDLPLSPDSPIIESITDAVGQLGGTLG